MVERFSLFSFMDNLGGVNSCAAKMKCFLLADYYVIFLLSRKFLRSDMLLFAS